MSSGEGVSGRMKRSSGVSGIPQAGRASAMPALSEGAGSPHSTALVNERVRRKRCAVCPPSGTQRSGRPDAVAVLPRSYPVRGYLLLAY